MLAFSSDADYASFMSRIPQSVKTAHSVGHVLSNSDASLGKLLRHARHLARLEDLLRTLIEPELADRFQVAAARENRLLLITPTAAWATRIRMMAPQLIESLRSSGAQGIEFIDIRVAPLSLEPVVSRIRRPLTPAAAQALEHMAQLGSWDKD
jgi:hypothetical protein